MPDLVEFLDQRLGTEPQTLLAAVNEAVELGYLKLYKPGLEWAH